MIEEFFKLEFLLGPGLASVVNDNASANGINDVKRNVKNEKNDWQENENRFTFLKFYHTKWAPLNGITDNGIKIIQIDKSQNPLSYLMKTHSLIIISQLLESVWICPKVIPLSSFHCTLVRCKRT
jgi:hypothetical protein